MTTGSLDGILSCKVSLLLPVPNASSFGLLVFDQNGVIWESKMVWNPSLGDDVSFLATLLELIWHSHYFTSTTHLLQSSCEEFSASLSLSTSQLILQRRATIFSFV